MDASQIGGANGDQTAILKFLQGLKGVGQFTLWLSHPRLVPRSFCGVVLSFFCRVVVSFSCRAVISFLCWLSPCLTHLANVSLLAYHVAWNLAYSGASEEGLAPDLELRALRAF